MDIQTRIGLRIKEIRTSKNLTQEAVAFKADIDRTNMNHVENGRKNISVTTLEKVVCGGLQMTLKDFFNDEIFSKKAKG
jgi:transcriptional regulator with XRE-family HTH domain